MDIAEIYALEMIRKRRLRQSAGYRTSDLVLHLDGINNTGSGHSSNATTWKDLAGNMDVALYNTTWGSDCCVFTGADDSYGLGAKWTFQTHGTFEVVYSREYSKNLHGIAGWTKYNTVSSRPGIYVESGRVSAIRGLGGGAVSNFTHPANGVRLYAAFTSTAIYQNTQTYTIPSHFIAAETTNNFRIGAYGSDSNTNYVGMGLPGRIYAVRVYDANLTAEELYAHWLIDKARFNITEA